MKGYRLYGRHEGVATAESFMVYGLRFTVHGLRFTVHGILVQGIYRRGRKYEPLFLPRHLE